MFNIFKILADKTRLRKRTRTLNVLRMQVEQEFARFHGQTVLYYPSAGNAGDSFISASTMQMFHRLGIDYRLITLESEPEPEIVVLGGGGNLVAPYPEIRNALLGFHDSAREIILLPHTIRGNDDVLGKLDGRCTIFCRDCETLQHVTTHAPAVRALLAHDMAFHMDTDALFSDEELARNAEPIWREKLEEAELSEDELRSRPMMNFWRVDIESTVPGTKVNSGTDADISFLYLFGTAPPKAKIATWCFLKTISACNSIRTDRLHIAIAAALLDVPCELYDNSYGKNEVVYRHSLDGGFPGVQFRGTRPVAPGTDERESAG